MPTVVKLFESKKNKADEFYTLYSDIEEELKNYIEYNPDVFRDKMILLPCDDYEKSNFTTYFVNNFEKLGTKKLISTSYAEGIRRAQSSLFEAKNVSRGKLLVKTKECEKRGILKGFGDFRSDEVSRLRDEADVIITNPPFSLFCEFWKWIQPDKKKFLVLGHLNCSKYYDVFDLLKVDKAWLGNTKRKGDVAFIIANDYEVKTNNSVVGKDKNIVRVTGIRWFTNLEYKDKYSFIKTNTIEYNLKNNRQLVKILNNKYKAKSYPKYDNFDALEIPLLSAIPSDYDGVMGVPITIFDKYNPEQFEIIGTSHEKYNSEMKNKKYRSITLFDEFGRENRVVGSEKQQPLIVLPDKPAGGCYYIADGNSSRPMIAVYERIFIRNRRK